jgi:hypothetical protein
MKLLNKLLGATALVLAAAMPSAHADYILNFSNAGAFSGTGPNVAGTFARATFADQGGGTIRLTMSVLGNLTAGAFIDEWYFNVNADPTQLLYSKVNVANNVSLSTFVTTQNPNGSPNCCKADGTGGAFDFLITFPNGQPHELDANSFSSYDLSLNGGTLTMAMIEDIFSVPDPSNNPATGGYRSAIHVQGFNFAGSSSVWIAAQECNPVVEQCENPNPETEIPEPGTLTIVGLGLASLALLRRRTR